MSRLKNKIDLLELSNQKFSELQKLIDSLEEQEINAEFNFDEAFLKEQKAAHWRRDKNIRDVLIHLYEWHQLLLNWVNYNQNGINKPFLPVPYNWRTYSEMNLKIWEKHQDTSYIEAKRLLETSHLKVTKLINSFSDTALFSKGYFSWTGNTTLGSYCISSTSSHYDWAVKKIKKYIKTLYLFYAVDNTK